MLTLVLIIIVGIIGGIAAGLQAVFAGLMGQRLGNLESVFFTYVGGGLMAICLVLLLGGKNLGAWRSVPWYAYAAGPLGLVIIGSISYTVPRLGTATATTLFVAAWLVISALIDHFGLFDTPLKVIDLPRAAGIAALMVGTWLMTR